ncbi:MAG: CRTAC1 family protein [Planctomycetota bacterium]
MALLLIALAACGDDSSGSQAQPEASSHRAEFEKIAERLFEGSPNFLGESRRRELEVQLLRGTSTDAKVQVLMDLAFEDLRAGENDAARRHIDEATALAKELPYPLPTLHWRRAIVYLRIAEQENCVRRHNRECCLLPIRGGGVHDLAEPAREARRSLLAYLEDYRDDLGARWLLNVVSMAIGDWPIAVPEAWRLAPELFESEEDIGQFVDVAPQLGVDTFNLCGGSVIEDFDGDGWLDIVTTTYDPLGPMTYYRNTGQGGFEDRTEAAHLQGQLGGLNCLSADYDGDGDADLLVLRGAWMFDDGRIRNSLLRNDGGVFRDVTREVGLAFPAFPTQAATFGDFDGDGDLDLFVGNESRVTFDRGGGDFPSQLFIQSKEGIFTNRATSAGVTNDRYAKGVTAGDYDNDGDLDLYVSNRGANRLYRNDGDLRFTDVAGELGVQEPGKSFATWFFDYDNDGWLDLFVAGYEATIADLTADLLGQDDGAVRPRLYRNLGGKGFEDVTAEAGLDHVYLPMGANFGDVDNDGFLDMYLATGDPEFESLMPNVLLRNVGGKRFVNVTGSGRLGHLQKGHGVAFGDLDHDGDQDLYHQLGGFYRGDRFRNALFENPGHGNRFLFVKLIGRQSPRSGYGARIRVEVEDASGEVREIHRAVGSVSSFGGSPARQEIGLGQATRIRALEIRWPNTEARSYFDIPLDRMIEIEEGSSELRTIELRAVSFYR